MAANYVPDGNFKTSTKFILCVNLRRHHSNAIHSPWSKCRNFVPTSSKHPHTLLLAHSTVFILSIVLRFLWRINLMLFNFMFYISKPYIIRFNLFGRRHFLQFICAQTRTFKHHPIFFWWWWFGKGSRFGPFVSVSNFVFFTVPRFILSAQIFIFKNIILILSTRFHLYIFIVSLDHRFCFGCTKKIKWFQGSNQSR